MKQKTHAILLLVAVLLLALAVYFPYVGTVGGLLLAGTTLHLTFARRSALRWRRKTLPQVAVLLTVAAALLQIQGMYWWQAGFGALCWLATPLLWWLIQRFLPHGLLRIIAMFATLSICYLWGHLCTPTSLVVGLAAILVMTTTFYYNSLKPRPKRPPKISSGAVLREGAFLMFFALISYAASFLIGGVSRSPYRIGVSFGLGIWFVYSFVAWLFYKTRWRKVRYVLGVFFWVLGLLGAAWCLNFFGSSEYTHLAMILTLAVPSFLINATIGSSIFPGTFLRLRSQQLACGVTLAGCIILIFGVFARCEEYDERGQWWRLADLRFLHNIKTITLSSTTIPDFEFLANRKSMRSLNMAHNRKVCDLTGIERCKQLEAIVCTAQSDEDLVRIAGMPNIKCLDLHLGYEVTQVEVLTKVKKLRELRLVNRGKSIDFAPLTKLHNLQVLELSTGNERVKWPRLPELKNLEELKINAFRSEVDFVPLATLNKVKKLYLSCANESPDLTPLAGMVSLEEADFNFDTSQSDFTPLTKLKNLQNVSLDDIRNIEHLRQVAKLRNLKELRLNIDAATKEDEDVEESLDFSSLANFSHLKKLTLAGEASMQPALCSELPKLASLQELYLEGGSEIIDFTPIAAIPNLRVLEIMGCRCDGNLKPLAAAKNLRRLRISIYGGISRSDVEILREKMPDCKITVRVGWFNKF